MTFSELKINKSYIVASLTNDKYTLTECNQTITPETINMAKKVWLDNGGVEKYKFDGIVKQELDYAFSHI